jgi:hypothetical protein
MSQVLIFVAWNYLEQHNGSLPTNNGVFFNVSSILTFETNIITVNLLLLYFLQCFLGNCCSNVIIVIYCTAVLRP